MLLQDLNLFVQLWALLKLKLACCFFSEEFNLFSLYLGFELAMLGAVFYLLFCSSLFLFSLVFKVFLLPSKQIINFLFLLLVNFTFFLIIIVAFLQSFLFILSNHLVFITDLLKSVRCFFNEWSPQVLTLPLHYALDWVASWFVEHAKFVFVTDWPGVPVVYPGLKLN